jgi:hypothetical protein
MAGVAEPTALSGFFKANPIVDRYDRRPVDRSKSPSLRYDKETEHKNKAETFKRKINRGQLHLLYSTWGGQDQGRNIPKLKAELNSTPA